MKLLHHINTVRLSLWGGLLLAALFAAHVLVPRHQSTLPDDIRITALATDTLSAPGLGSSTFVWAGEEVRLLGVVSADGPRHPARLWVETSNGMLGYADPRVFDTVGVVLRRPRRGGFRVGDSVTLVATSVNTSGWSRYEVRRRDGTTGTLDASDVATVTALRFLRHHDALEEHPRRLMSTRTFERRYLRHSYRENRNHDMPPQLAVANDSGFTTLENICLLGRDGRWYRPRLCYNRDSIATGYKVAHGFDRNTALTRLLYPVTQTLLRSPLTAWQGSRAVYRPISAESRQGLWRWSARLRQGLLWLLIQLPWIYLSPFMLSLLLYALLCRPSLLQRLDNRALQWLLSVLAVLSALWWMVVMLPVVPMGYYLVVELPLIVLYVRALHHGLLSDQVPHGRCPSCRHIHTVRPAGLHLVKENEEWNIPYAPSASINPVSDDDVLYRVREYSHRFRCRQCGHEESYISREVEEINRVKKASRTDSYHIRRGGEG